MDYNESHAGASGVVLPVQQAIQYASAWKRELHFAFIILLFLPPLFGARRHVRNMRKYPAYINNGIPYAYLIFHVAHSIAETLRWHISGLYQHSDPVPDKIDLWSALIWIPCAFIVVPRNTRSYATHIRTGFQAATALRVIAIVMSHWTHDAAWHKASVSMLHSFAYTRWLIIFFNKHKIMLETVNRIFLALLLGFYVSVDESSFPSGITLLIGLHCFFIAFDTWISRLVTLKDLEESSFWKSMAFAGFVDRFELADPKKRKKKE